jgi:hypothetical protein
MYFDGCVILGRFFGEAVGVFTVHALGCLAPRIAEKLAHVPPALQVGPLSRGLVIGRQAHGSIRGIAERKSLTQDPLEAHFHFRESFFFFFFLHHTPFFWSPEPLEDQLVDTHLSSLHHHRRRHVYTTAPPNRSRYVTSTSTPTTNAY